MGFNSGFKGLIHSIPSVRIPLKTDLILSPYQHLKLRKKWNLEVDSRLLENLYRPVLSHSQFRAIAKLF